MPARPSTAIHPSPSMSQQQSIGSDLQEFRPLKDIEWKSWIHIDCGSIARVWLTSKIQDEIEMGVIPAMTSDSVPAFLIDWTKYDKHRMLPGNPFRTTIHCRLQMHYDWLDLCPRAQASGYTKWERKAYVATVLRFSMSTL
ncbi:hypothetical protein GYMLUDRAFT_45683 [Collybiopsis luxurians FD-317 M1]|uniref:Uncharacterized protein n=1 Tax=Collybiopsis luxurians FD-317 M1 TaxID=944289 RepID=A0A0D0CIK4_9AGAR|nr:hypothetical protein GYMLUDRAFT_45683 [Collybiopsis luxurians FD-317 M1]